VVLSKGSWSAGGNASVSPESGLWQCKHVITVSGTGIGESDHSGRSRNDFCRVAAFTESISSTSLHPPSIYSFNHCHSSLPASRVPADSPSNPHLGQPSIELTTRYAPVSTAINHNINTFHRIPSHLLYAYCIPFLDLDSPTYT